MTACKCSERKQKFASQLPPGSNDRPRAWFVINRNESRSAFNGYRPQWSDYSTIHCRVCGAYWKTKASWVDELPNCEFFPSRNPPRVEPIYFENNS